MPSGPTGALLAVVVFAAVAGCATKEVALEVIAGGADAGVDGGAARQDAPLDQARQEDVVPEARFPIPFCLTFVDATGVSCSACYDEWGNESSRSCKPLPVKCQVRDEPSGTRCLYCDDNPTVAKACLKCDAPMSDCAQCLWSDDSTVACKRCVDAAGTVIADGCDALRGELR